MNKKKYAALKRIIKFINTIGKAGKNNIEKTFVYEQGKVNGKPEYLSIHLNSELGYGYSYGFRDYTLEIENINRKLIIETEASDEIDEESVSYKTLISIKYQFPNGSSCIANSYIVGWNNDNIENLTLEKFMENETHERNGEIPVDYKKYLFDSEELDRMLEIWKEEIKDTIERKQEDIRIVEERLKGLSEPQIKEMKKILLGK